MTMGDRIVVMNDGVIQQVETPLILYNHPKNMFVAGFIGSPAMNFFEGELIDETELQFKTESFNIPVGSALHDKLKKHKNMKVILGARPEHFRVIAKQTETGGAIKSVVEVLEPMGNEIIAYFNSGDSTFTVRCPANIDLEIGENVLLELDMENIHFFEKDSGTVLV